VHPGCAAKEAEYVAFCFEEITYHLTCSVFCLHRYDSITDSSRNDMKRKFALTMEFVEEYLKEVVNQPFPFGDKEKNKLTFEVF
jgi:hypothetical protein